MKAVRVLFLVCSVMLFASQAGASNFYMSGNTLLDDAVACNKFLLGEPSDATRATAFLMYSAGLFDGLRYSIDFDHIPPSVTIGQTAQIFAQYIINHPEDRHLGAPQLLVKAMLQKFPKTTQ